jgi:hypothetical protein
MKSAPPPPDFQGIAQQQSQANRPNISTPFGQQTWTTGPDGKPQMQTGFSGGLGAAADGLQAQAAGMASPMDWSQFGPLDDGSAAREQAINSAYTQATSRLDPQWQQRESQMRTQLANQGLDPNSEAARGANMQMGQQRNDAYTGAMASAIQQGTAAQAATFGQNMAARQQAIAEALRKRGQPISELQQMQGLLSMPGYNQDNSSLAAAGMQANYGLQSAQMQNQMWGDIIGAGGQLAASAPALFGLSDARAKTDIQPLGVDALPGVPFVEWTYRPEVGLGAARHMGVLAQDLARVSPRHVRARPDGLLEVDYSFLNEVPHVL